MEGVIENLEEAMDRVFGKYHKKRHQESSKKLTLKFDIPKSQSTNANGNLDMEVYGNPMARILRIGRITIWADEYTPNSPYKDSTGNTTWYGIFTGPNAPGAPKDFFPYSPASTQPLFPNVAEYSGLNALQFDHQEKVHFYLIGGPVNTNITVEVTGFAEPIATDFEL